MAQVRLPRSHAPTTPARFYQTCPSHTLSTAELHPRRRPRRRLGHPSPQPPNTHVATAPLSCLDGVLAHGEVRGLLDGLHRLELNLVAREPADIGAAGGSGGLGLGRTPEPATSAHGARRGLAGAGPRASTILVTSMSSSGVASRVANTWMFILGSGTPCPAASPRTGAPQPAARSPATDGPGLLRAEVQGDPLLPRELILKGLPLLLVEHRQDARDALAHRPDLRGVTERASSARAQRGGGRGGTGA